MSRHDAIGEEEASPYIEAVRNALRGHLWNWARWTWHDALPDLDCGGPSWAEFWKPSGNARDYGWGDPTPPEAPPVPIDEKDAARIDRLLMRLAWKHRRILIRHFAHRDRQRQEDVDHACVRLYELMQPIDAERVVR